MAMIGEELMALLGMIPVRDRAGIARGNLAQETMANTAAMDQLPERGPPIAPRPPIATPPDVTLPDEVPVGYASAKSPVSTAIPSNSRIVQNAVPEPDTTRTIAATPPAATGQMEEMLARVQRANAIRSAIGGFQQAFGGGGGDGGGTQMAGGIDTKDITDMFKTRELLQKADDDRRAAAQAVQVRERMIQDMMDRRGWSRARAEGAIASGEAKDVYSQDKVRQFAEDQATVAQRDAMAKRKGEIATKLGMTEDEVATQLLTREGTTDLIKRLDPESRSVIAGRNATTAETTQKTVITGADFGVRSEGMKNPEAIATRLSARLGRTVDPDEVRLAAATEENWKDFIKQTTEGGQTEIKGKATTAAKTRQEVAREAEQSMSYEDAKADPSAFARRYDLSPSAVERATANRPAYEKFTADRSGATTASVQGFEYDRARAREGGPEALRAFDTKYPDLPTYERLKIPSTIEGPEEKARTELMTGRAKRFTEKDEPAAREIEKTISIANHNAQRLWDEKLITGGGQYSVAEEKGRKLAAKYLGYGDDAVQSTQLFFNARKADALKMRGTDMPGAMSDADREFLLEISGNRDMSAQTLKRLLMIQEKYQRALLENHNAEVRRLKAASPKAYADVQEIAQPKLGRFHEEALATPKMQALLKGIRENPDNERLRTRFNEEMGAGMADRYAPREPRS